MTIKIKILIIFLAIVALFSVYYASNSLHLLALKSPIFLSATPLASPDADPDHDGLTNLEEAYWNTDPFNSDTDGDGYLDGEEVASDHDPLIPGPNDLLNSGNLTEKLSNLTLAGLYEGSLSKDSSQSEQGLNDLALSVIDDGVQSFNKDVDLSKIRIVEPTKENQEIYIRWFSDVFPDFLKNYFGEMNNLAKYLDIINQSGFANKNLVNYFSAQTNAYQRELDDVLNSNVPKNWQTEHAAFAKLVQNILEKNRSIASGDKDPVKAVIAINAFFDIPDVATNVRSLYLQKVEAQNLDTKSTIFEK